MGIYDEAVDAFAMPAVTKTTESFTALNNGVGGASMAEQMKVMSEQMEKLQTDQPKPKPVRKKVSKLRSNKVTGLRNPVTPEEIALYHPDAFVISNHLYASVRKNLEQHVGVTAAKNVHVTEDWLHQGELLLVTDGIEASRVLTLIDWVAQDGFWRTNIRGMAKLRLQSERLLMDPGFLRWAVANNRTILNPAVATAEVAQGSGRPQGRVRAVALDTSKVLYSESI